MTAMATVRYLAALLLLAGCHDPLTEVVLVIDSDLKVSAEVDTIHVSVDDLTLSEGLGTFPVSLGVLSQGMRNAFSLHVGLSHSPASQTFVVARSATGIRFVDGETMMLRLKLSSACACAGTNCPDPTGIRDCQDLASPPLEPFDPAVAPHESSGQLRAIPSGEGCTPGRESGPCP
jgi:hypothetical protein